MEALNNNGVKAKMLVRDKQTDNVSVVGIRRSLTTRLRFVWERAQIYMTNGCTKNNLWAIDTGAEGVDITTLREFEEADIIHLHWVNQAFLSLRSIERILASGKPVVWTMHDMWPSTSICHHAGDCTAYETHCHDCPLLQHPGAKDLSYKVFDRKRRLYDTNKADVRGGLAAFICCSHWLEGQARKSALLRGHDIECIPNALDTNLFAPGDQADARQRLELPLDKKLLLFGSLKVTDKRKGIDYLLDAARTLSQRYPQWADKLGFVVMGQEADQLKELLPFPVYSMGYVSNTHCLATIYRAVDAFVTPSLFENLPNTIAEAMACGRPCVGFRVGGIPEMIHHEEDGYVAEYKDADDLARGIDYVLTHPEMGEAAHRYALHAYNESRVAKQHIDLYERLLQPRTRR